MFCKKDVLENFAKFTRKHLYQSLFFNNVTALSPATLLKKRLWHSCFSVTFAKFLRTPFLTEHLLWLLLHIRRKRTAIDRLNSFRTKVFIWCPSDGLHVVLQYNILSNKIWVWQYTHSLTKCSYKVEQSEAFARRCSKKWVFLKILRNSQENTCVLESLSR